MTLGLRDRGRVEDDIIWKVKAKELIWYTEVAEDTEIT